MKIILIALFFFSSCSHLDVVKNCRKVEAGADGKDLSVCDTLWFWE